MSMWNISTEIHPIKLYIEHIYIKLNNIWIVIINMCGTHSLYYIHENKNIPAILWQK